MLPHISNLNWKRMNWGQLSFHFLEGENPQLDFQVTETFHCQPFYNIKISCGNFIPEAASLTSGLSVLHKVSHELKMLQEPSVMALAPPLPAAMCVPYRHEEVDAPTSYTPVSQKTDRREPRPRGFSPGSVAYWGFSAETQSEFHSYRNSSNLRK